MKYKTYILTFQGDPAIVAFLKTHVPKRQDNLGHARKLGRAARLLFGVVYNVTSVTRAQPTAERVKPL